MAVTKISVQQLSDELFKLVGKNYMFLEDGIPGPWDESGRCTYHTDYTELEYIDNDNVLMKEPSWEQIKRCGLIIMYHYEEEQPSGNALLYVTGIGVVYDVDNFEEMIYISFQKLGAGGEIQLEFDDQPTENSLNPVTSNGIYEAILDAYNHLMVFIQQLQNHKISDTEKGAANGVAELGANGKVLTSQLPAYVDEVIEAYYKDADGKFYEDAGYTIELTPIEDAIYVDLVTNKTYRWSGTQYVEISASLALGETAYTAYRGDRGKAAYEHSLIRNSNPHDTDASQIGAMIDWNDDVNKRGRWGDPEMVSEALQYMVDHWDENGGYNIYQKTALLNSDPLIYINDYKAGDKVVITTQGIGAGDQYGIELKIDRDLDWPSYHLRGLYGVAVLEIVNTAPVDYDQEMVVNLDQYASLIYIRQNFVTTTGTLINNVYNVYYHRPESSGSGTIWREGLGAYLHQSSQYQYLVTTNSTQTIESLKNFKTFPRMWDKNALPTRQEELTNKLYVDNQVQAVRDLIRTIDTLKREIVDELPTENISLDTIYMVLQDNPGASNIYDEYMYIEDNWEIIGSTAIDLSNYLAKDNIIPYTPSDFYHPATVKFVIDRIEWDLNVFKDVELKNYLAKDNTTPYVPTDDYHPATLATVMTEKTNAINTVKEWTNDNFLAKNNTKYYEPTANYHPSTKKYVDDNIAKISKWKCKKRDGDTELKNKEVIKLASNNLSNIISEGLTKGGEGIIQKWTSPLPGSWIAISPNYIPLGDMPKNYELLPDGGGRLKYTLEPNTFYNLRFLDGRGDGGDGDAISTVTWTKSIVPIDAPWSYHTNYVQGDYAIISMYSLNGYKQYGSTAVNAAHALASAGWVDQKDIILFDTTTNIYYLGDLEVDETHTTITETQVSEDDWPINDNIIFVANFTPSAWIKWTGSQADLMTKLATMETNRDFSELGKTAVRYFKITTNYDYVVTNAYYE